MIIVTRRRRTGLIVMPVAAAAVAADDTQSHAPRLSGRTPDSIHTVRKHMQDIFVKLPNVCSATAVSIRLAIQSGAARMSTVCLFVTR